MPRRSLLGVIAFISVTGMVSSATAALAGSLTARGSAVAPTTVRLAKGAPGIGFDDTPYDRATNRIYVPGGRSGNLFEINPDTARSRVLVGGFSKSNKFNGDHDFGITSVSAARGFLFVTDRTTQRLSVVKRSTGSVVATTKLAAAPDIVRYVAATNKLWVTEPDKEQIEVLTGPSTGAVRPRHVAFISVPGGPEALVIDQAHGRAYTEAAAAKTVVINVKTRKVSYGWTSGCKTPKELAIDEQRNLAFTACNEGGIYAVDLAHGRRVVAHAATRGDVDFPAYNAKLRHLYVASGLAKKVSIFAVGATGGLTRLGTVPGARHGSNVLATPNGDIWVPRPYKGDVLRVADPFVRHR